MGEALHEYTTLLNLEVIRLKLAKKPELVMRKETKHCGLWWSGWDFL
ncbi:hypothetical protein PC116_g24837 [Phytophthora cactorum]|uniref:Uncharacterized protein n=1 Tax=Phytophthora cactorum TaxID=29920 RepID=A0A329SIE3_9STRA|nr:hypothetical protein Pcac1_g17052 [Phytophthora cactorum]KAG2879642.1 hypothetical protein PC114_g22460 [Phytophthora cactorum]KAG2909951.1 hypothetical protein PC117_g19532 [Phytophthora cactorum]KAG2975796.1 hypothetical protein PC119_g22386 [Phytophthora cactorum]KAG3004183.1 hypothetical protein PC120_g18735 [Phytophthora cactorum]